MAENTAVVVDWFGPYKGEDREDMVGAMKAARTAARQDWSGRGLYAAIGQMDGATRGPRQILYVGIGDLPSRVTSRHHKLKDISFGSIWLGEVSVAGIPGRRIKFTNPHLDIVEWASVFFLKIPYCEKKRVKPPSSSFVLLNRWWNTDYETEAARPAARWADIVEWDSYRQRGNLVWFGARGRVVPIPKS